jgi:hypothetical protein
LHTQVRASPGPPQTWGIAVLEDGTSEGLTQATRHTEDLCQACGEPFWVEMEVLDRHANPCPPTSVLALGPPTFAPQLELLELDRPLQVRLWPLRVFHHSTGLGLGLGLG